MWVSIGRRIMLPCLAFPGDPPMRFGLFAALILIATAIHPMCAFAEKRVALVIGNSAYQNVPKLLNPVNDARAVAALLKNAGFDVVESRSDLGIANIKRAMRDFANVALDADIGVIYYAGHGIEVEGTNYLIPVDAALERDIDVDDETVSLDRVLKSLEPVKRLRLIILDACRDNPFTRSMKRTIASRSVGRGLAKVEPMTSDTLIAVCGQGRLDRAGWRRKEQSVHGRLVETPSHAGSRPAYCVWPSPRRRVEGHVEQARAIRLWFPWWHHCVAGPGPGTQSRVPFRPFGSYDRQHFRRTAGLLRVLEHWGYEGSMERLPTTPSYRAVCQSCPHSTR